MHPLLKIIQKNLKLLIRSKSSALIIILGPLLVIFLAGIAFDNLNKYSINIGVYSEQYSNLTESFITKLQENEFNVQKFDLEEPCVDSIKYAKIHTCIIFPKNMQVESNDVNEITFYIDNSKINLVWMVLDTLSSKLSERSSELSVDLTTNLLEKLELTKREVSENRPVITNLQTENQGAMSEISNLNKDLVSGKVTSLKDRTSVFKSFLIKQVNDIEENLADIEDEIDVLNDGGADTEALEDYVEDTKNNIMEIEKQIEAGGDYLKIVSSVIEMESSLKSGLNSVDSAISKSSSKINKIKDSFDKIYEKVQDLKINNAATIVNPITTNIKPVVPEKTYLNYMFPALIVLVVMFISILLSTTLVMMEKHSPAYFRNFITPTRNITFILGTYLTSLIIVLLQLVIIVIIALIFFKSQVLLSLPKTGLLLLIVTSFFTLAGMFVGSLFTSEETATLASISLGSVFLFLSNIILPIESMPEYVRNIANFNPFIIAEGLLKKAILFNSKLAVMLNDILILIGYSFALLVVIWLIHTFSRRHVIFSLEKHSKEKLVKKK